MAEGSKTTLGSSCESVPFAPFAPTALAKSLSGAGALVVISQAAGGAGGIEPEVVPKLLKAAGPGQSIEWLRPVECESRACLFGAAGAG